MKKRLLLVFIPVIFLGVTGYLLIYSWLTLTPPEVSDTAILDAKTEQVGDSLSRLGTSWLHLNDKGLWELYTEGKPFERGVIAGKLTKDLIHFQEKAFMDRISELVPSMGYQRFLRLLIAIFNKDIDQYIPEEYLMEIYGMSRAAADEYDFVGPKYDRILHYHGAHDIGHMLQNYNLVGCTSFALWDGESADSSLIIGRNFDFYVGDEFAKNRIIQFCRPDSGHAFMMVTWGAMCGSVSGMNEQGLTLTLNAAKSAIPLSVAEPVSLIAREILQYASTIDEAYAIANHRKCFVSETYLIGSAKENRAAVIEIAPYKHGLYTVNGSRVICTNHLQSDSLKNDRMNLKHMERSASVYRYQRVEELLNARPRHDVHDVAAILRDRKGLQDLDIGLGNENALNQLLCHHSIIFKPGQKLVWVSTDPYQLGEYICYDLDDIFSRPQSIAGQGQFYKKELTLPPDSFLRDEAWKKFIEFRKQSVEILNNRQQDSHIFSKEEMAAFVMLNPEYFYTYEICGDYWTAKAKYSEAVLCYKQALGKVIPNQDERERIWEKIKKCEKELN